MVTSLHEDNDSVTVEWIENGDTKGKEVQLLHLQQQAPVGGACLYSLESFNTADPDRFGSAPSSFPPSVAVDA